MSRTADWEAAAAALAASRDLWPAEVPREYGEPLPGATLNDYLHKWAEERPHTTAIHFYGRSIDYAELERAAASFAGWLQAEGVGPGDRVGVYLVNCPQLTIAFLGILRIGAVYVPINPMFKAQELAYELSDAGVSVLLAHPEFAPQLAAVLPELERSTAIGYTRVADMISGEPKPQAPFGAVDRTQHSDWEEILSTPPADPVAVDRDALAALNYTGGTTGMPKGCEHTQGHMIYTAVSALLGQGRTPGAGGDVALGFLPMFWIAGEDMCMLNPLIDGSTVVMMTRWHPEVALELISAQRVTSIVAPADNYVELMALPEFHTADTSSLRSCSAVSFVRKLDPELRGQWREATGVILREASYGMTETHTADTFTLGLNAADQDLRAEPIYCGYPVPGTQIVVVDADLVPVPPGEAGQILVHSPSLLSAYYNKAEATAAALVDGWLLTGDTGRFDEHGALTYLARTKEMIKVNGMSVFPAEVESFFKAHAAVERVAVAPREDSETGQRPVAFVELVAGADTSAEQLRAWARQQMAGYKVPEVVLVETMPMTATGKIRKVELIEELSI